MKKVISYQLNQSYNTNNFADQSCDVVNLESATPSDQLSVIDDLATAITSDQFSVIPNYTEYLGEQSSNLMNLEDCALYLRDQLSNDRKLENSLSSLGNKFSTISNVQSDNDYTSVKAGGYSTSLHLTAFKGGMVNFGKALIANKSAINAKDEQGKAVIHMLLSGNKTLKLNLLLENKPEIDIKDNMGNTSLHIAILKRNLLAVEKLLVNKASVNVQNNAGNTPVHLAVLMRNQAILRRLLQHGVDINTENKQGDSPLKLAVLKNYPFGVQLLLKYSKINLNTQDRKGNTILHLVIVREKIGLIKLFLYYGADPSIKNYNGTSCFRLAEIVNNKEITDSLLPYKALNTVNVSPVSVNNQVVAGNR